MALVSLNLKPSDKQLRDFGDVALLMCSLMGLVLMWQADLPFKVAVVIYSFGLATYLLSRISVKLVKPVYVGLMAVTFPIGWVISHAVMAIFYYVIITGVGLIFKLLKRDPLHRAYDPQAASYWIPYRHNRKPADYFHQF